GPGGDYGRLFKTVLQPGGNDSSGDTVGRRTGGKRAAGSLADGTQGEKSQFKGSQKRRKAPISRNGSRKCSDIAPGGRTVKTEKRYADHRSGIGAAAGT